MNDETSALKNRSRFDICVYQDPRFQDHYKRIPAHTTDLYVDLRYWWFHGENGGTRPPMDDRISSWKRC